MHIDVITLFPELFQTVTESGVTGRAFQSKIWSLKTWNPRDYTHNVHNTVDDRPYGGGPGMVMMAQPLADAVEDIRAQEQASGSAPKPVILLSPTGTVFKQGRAHELAESPGFILVCGRYEGIDQRFIDSYVDQQISLGDFVLSGGELAALPLIDACVRLLPGVLNDERSAIEDSFSDGLGGLLDCEHYTRPPQFQGLDVPDTLKSGDHAKIRQWRRQCSLAKTALHRPDLLERVRENGLLSESDISYLKQLDQH